MKMILYHLDKYLASWRPCPLWSVSSPTTKYFGWWGHQPKGGNESCQINVQMVLYFNLLGEFKGTRYKRASARVFIWHAFF